MANWNPDEAVMLYTNAKKYPSWESVEEMGNKWQYIELNGLEEARHIEYKFILKNHMKKETRWEEGENRTVDLSRFYRDSIIEDHVIVVEDTVFNCSKSTKRIYTLPKRSLNRSMIDCRLESPAKGRKAFNMSQIIPLSLLQPLQHTSIRSQSPSNLDETVYNESNWTDNRRRRDHEGQAPSSWTCPRELKEMGEKINLNKTERKLKQEDDELNDIDKSVSLDFISLDLQARLHSSHERKLSMP
mmetsp:Transcript_9421/g.14422  ORF Transcript_9421/g.14422 Transcript_9421/m.14422 type:complete len:244 (+) Transcript_9421:91-822(+)